MLIFRELRFVAVDFENDPAVVAGATLSDLESVVFLRKRGETEVEDVIAEDPEPAIAGDQVRLWVDTRGEDFEAGRYLIRAVVTLSNGEVAQADAGVVVE